MAAKRRVYLFGIGSPAWIRRDLRGAAHVPGVIGSRAWNLAAGKTKPKRRRRRKR